MLATLIVVVVATFSIVYFLYRLDDAGFRDNAMGNLFATMVGLVVGIPIGLEINRRQQEEIEAKEQKAQEAKKQEKLRVLSERLEKELTYNWSQVKRLNTALQLSPNARKDLWELASVIVDSFAFRAKDDLYTAGLHFFLPKGIETKVFTAYNALRGLYHEIKMAVYAHAFYYGYSGDATRANQLLEDAESQGAHVLSLVEETLDVLRKYRV